MIFIRADANAKIATGHVMRCLSIAEQVQKMGEEVSFITADEYPSQMIRSKGFKNFVLNSDWKDMQLELERLVSYIRSNQVKTILVDSYQVTEEYFKELNKYIRVVYLDDIAKFHYTVDDIINYNISAEKLGYEQEYENTDTKLWLGCKYIPLRKEFQNIGEKNIRNQICDVVITMGGSDELYLSEDILSTFAVEYPDICFHMIVGKFFKNKDRLYELANRYRSLVLYENVQKMSELMLRCDLAVSAGGTTLYELCACGVPTICFSLADNQVSGAEELEKQGIMLYAGDARGLKKQFLEKIKQCFEQIQNFEIRKQLSSKMQQLVDGKGVERIVEQIICCDSQYFQLQ